MLTLHDRQHSNVLRGSLDGELPRRCRTSSIFVAYGIYTAVIYEKQTQKSSSIMSGGELPRFLTLAAATFDNKLQQTDAGCTRAEDESLLQKQGFLGKAADCAS